MASSCVRLSVNHPFHLYQTIRKPKLLLSSPSYVHVNHTSSLTNASYFFSNPLPITTQKSKLQFLSSTTLHYPLTVSSTTTSKTRICKSVLRENTSLETIPKIPATEIGILVFGYIIPFLNRLSLTSKFPVIKYAINPLMPLLGFYQSIPTLCLITFLALFIGFARYRNFRKFKYSLQALVMDIVVVAASLVRPFLVNPGHMAGGPLGFKLQLLNVLGLLGFQTCVHSCLECLGASQLWIGEENNVNITSDPSIDTFVHMMEVVIKNEENDGRRAAKSLVLKILSENSSLFSSSETCDKNILSLCRSCLNSLVNLYIKAEVYYKINQHVDKDIDRQISLEVENLLWLLDLLADRQAVENFAMMWANQQKLAHLHKKFCSPSRYLVSCITTRLLAGGLGNGEIPLAKRTRQMLLQTWFQPLVDDYSCLKKLKSFDLKAVEENIERAIVELTPEAQQTGLTLRTGLWEQQSTSYIQEVFIRNKLILKIYFENLVEFGRQNLLLITVPLILLLCVQVLFLCSVYQI